MKTLVPNYYPQFKCIADKCRHSCCIGWEIDIDEDSLARFRSIGGKLGKALSENIELDPTPHFILGKDERCPFLDEQGLCCIIRELGEQALCDICADHPRFRNFFDSRVEMGLGLCCEAAAELILGSSEKAALIELESDGEALYFDDEEDFFALRDCIFDIIQNREKSFDNRITELSEHFDIRLPRKSNAQWAQFYLSLERLDEAWSEKLAALANFEADTSPLSDTVREQLLAYFIFRHLADGIYDGRVKERLGFALLGERIIGAICAACSESVFEIARMYSAEIEYSQENIEALLDMVGE